MISSSVAVCQVVVDHLGEVPSPGELVLVATNDRGSASVSRLSEGSSQMVASAICQQLGVIRQIFLVGYQLTDLEVYDAALQGIRHVVSAPVARLLVNADTVSVWQGNTWGSVEHLPEHIQLPQLAADYDREPTVLVEDPQSVFEPQGQQPVWSSAHPQHAVHDAPPPTSSGTWQATDPLSSPSAASVAVAGDDFLTASESSTRSRHSRNRRSAPALIQPPRRPFTVVVANPKGGSGKTPTTVMLSAALAHCTGLPVAALDVNPTGNLRVRLEHCSHEFVTIDDLAVMDELPDPRAITTYLQWQPDGQFAALPARPRKLIEGTDGQTRLDRPTISYQESLRVWQAVSAAYPIVVLDSGNNDADEPWRAALEVADVMVVPLRWSKDYCDGAARMLSTAATTGHEALVNRVVVVETSPELAPARRRREYAHYFESRFSAEILSIPRDSHIAARDSLCWSKLNAGTRKAATHLATTVIRRG